jgi:hypothetical protein
MPKSLEELQSLAKRVRREIIVMIGAVKVWPLQLPYRP